MAGKTPTRAVNNFLRPLRKVVDCITKTTLRVQRSVQSEKPHVLFLGEGEPVALKARDQRAISLTMIMGFQVVPAGGELGKYKVKTTSYFYQILKDESEIICYQWHPEETPKIWFPHIHVKGELSKIHLPTGRVSIEEVIRLLIVEFKIVGKSGWEDVLRETQRKFERYRTWANIPP